MHDEPNLLAGICANPDDDAPRLIYADWLDEHGQPERAEFIRVQVALARTPYWHPQYPPLAQRSQDLIAEFQLIWAKPVLDAGLSQWQFRRGFLEAITIGVPLLLRRGDLFRHVPTLQTVHLNEEGDYERLWREPYVEPWRELWLEDVAADAICAVLARAGRPLALRTLRFGYSGLTETGFGHLCRTVTLPHLHTLDLIHAELGEDAFEDFRAAPWATQLRSLHIANFWHNEAGLYRFPFTTLEELTLDSTHLQILAELQPFGSPTLPLLANVRVCRIQATADGQRDHDLRFLLNYLRLQRLHAEQVTMTGYRLRQSLELLARRPLTRIVLDANANNTTVLRNTTVPTLQPGTFEFVFRIDQSCDIGAWLTAKGYLAPEATVTLRGAGIDPTIHVGAWPELPQQTDYGIDLRSAQDAPELVCWQRDALLPNMALSDATMDHLNPIAVLEAQTQYTACDGLLDWPVKFRPHLHWSQRRLNFWAHSKFRDHELREVATNPALANIRELDLGATAITLQGVQALVESPYVDRLRSLRLSFNELGDGLAEMLAAAPNLRRLATLKLSFCNIGDLGVRALAKSPYLTRLTTLKLWHGRIGNTGASAIAQSATLQHLRGLRLRQNEIDDLGANAFAQSPYLRYIQQLDVLNNPIGDLGMNALEVRFHGKLDYCIDDFEPFPE